VILIFKHHFLVLMDPVFRVVGVWELPRCRCEDLAKWGDRHGPPFIEQVLYISYHNKRNSPELDKLHYTKKNYFPFFTNSAIYDPAFVVLAVPPISFVTIPSFILCSMAATTAAPALCSPI
jgi:hypothetical protein